MDARASLPTAHSTIDLPKAITCGVLLTSKLQGAKTYCASSSQRDTPVVDTKAPRSQPVLVRGPFPRSSQLSTARTRMRPLEW